MKKFLYLITFLILTTGLSFAEDKNSKDQPNTIFQKVADYSQEGYKEDVKPIKKVTVFQYMADWVNGTSVEKKSPAAEKPSLFWKGENK